MRRPQFIARQSSRPNGLVGRFIAWIMAKETAPLNDAALELLDLQPADRLLEIGFGHGKTIHRAAARLSEGAVTGIDVSETMLRVASRANRDAIREGRVELKLGDSARIDAPDHQFDKVLSVHTVYFWADPTAHLAEIARVLEPGGRFVLGFRPKGSTGTESFPASIYRFYSEAEIAALLGGAGLRVEDMVRVDDFVCAVARR